MEKSRVSVFIEENLKTIYAYALSRVSNKEDAEDLAGDIVLAILQSAKRIREDNAFYGYIWAIAGNTYKKYCRKRKAAEQTELDESLASDDTDIAELLCQAEELHRLRRELSILSREYRECTVAYYMGGLSCADTAKKLCISLEMVKYYLFKTRKLLKEGIVMEREFGEKSYNPSKFEFITIFSGQFNREYQHLFNRKLPGNILVSTYYTPMTVRELAIELGVASVYLEDEIELLVKYGLLASLPNGKYQASLVIFTEAYTNEFYRAAEGKCRGEMGAIMASMRGKLTELRKIGFTGCKNSDEHLLWAFLYAIVREGYHRFENAHPRSERKTVLYNGATGTYYGVDYERLEGEYSSGSFAGYSKIDDDKYAIFADFGILPEKNHYGTSCDMSHAPVLTTAQQAKAYEILAEEVNGFAGLYEHLFALAAETMKVHAPKHLGDMAEDVVMQTLFFRTVGLIGALAVHSGKLSVPADEAVKGLLVIDTSK